MKSLLDQILSKRPLDQNQTIDVFEAIISGDHDRATPNQIAALLAMIQLRGPSEDEIFGAATVMRRHVVRVETPPNSSVLDTCGTGGTGAKTFNISTTAAFIVAAAASYALETGHAAHRVVVAKHGNRSVTSKSGSSQVLEALGVNLNVTEQTLSRSLEQANMCFCFAPAHHPAMKHVAPIRAELGMRTLFNLVGPLANPAGANRQLIGVYDPALTEPVARVLQRLGTTHAMVIHTRLPQGGIGELLTSLPVQISELRHGKVSTRLLDTATLGLPLHPVEALEIESAEQSADIIRDILDGQPSPHRDTAVLNAAAALIVADIADSFETGIKQAQYVLDRGLAEDVLDQLIKITNASSAQRSSRSTAQLTRPSARKPIPNRLTYRRTQKRRLHNLGRA